MIALIPVRLTSIIVMARDRRKAYTDRNDIQQQVIMDLYESHIALAETVKMMADLMVTDHLDLEQTAEGLVKLTQQTLRLADHVVGQQVGQQVRPRDVDAVRRLLHDDEEETP